LASSAISTQYALVPGIFSSADTAAALGRTDDLFEMIWLLIEKGIVLAQADPPHPW
jgi:hypothetical protein